MRHLCSLGCCDNSNKENLFIVVLNVTQHCNSTGPFFLEKVSAWTSPHDSVFFWVGGYSVFWMALDTQRWPLMLAKCCRTHRLFLFCSYHRFTHFGGHTGASTVPISCGVSLPKAFVAQVTVPYIKQPSHNSRAYCTFHLFRLKLILNPFMGTLVTPGDNSYFCSEQCWVNSSATLHST